MLTQRFPSALAAQKRLDPAMPAFQLAPRKYKIDPLAFVLALIGAPLLVTLLTFWIYYIPLVALYLGSIPYLVLGVPALLIFMPRYGHGAGSIAGLAFGVTAAAVVIVAGAFALFHGPSEIGAVLFLGVFCLIFSALWGCAFGWLYGRLLRQPPAA